MKRFLSRLVESFKSPRKSSQSLAQQRRVRLEVEDLERRELMASNFGPVPNAPQVSLRVLSDGKLYLKYNQVGYADDKGQHQATHYTIYRYDSMKSANESPTPANFVGGYSYYSYDIWYQVPRAYAGYTAYYRVSAFTCYPTAKGTPGSYTWSAVYSWTAPPPVAPNLVIQTISENQLALHWNNVNAKNYTIQKWIDGQVVAQVETGSYNGGKVQDLHDHAQYRVGARYPGGVKWSALTPPAVFAAFNSGPCVLRIDGTNGADKISVQQVGGQLQVLSSGTSVPIYVDGDYKSGEASRQAGQVIKIVVHGWGGNDKIRLNRGESIEIESWLYGESGNNKIYGGAGFNHFFGGAGTNFFDPHDHYFPGHANTNGYTVDGGTGHYFIADQVALGSLEGDRDSGLTTMDDIKQRNSPTCAFLSSLAAVAHSEYLSSTTLGVSTGGFKFPLPDGKTLIDRITYKGDSKYTVHLFNDLFDMWVDQEIEFDGSYNTECDPIPLGKTDPGSALESWVILFQRAFLEMHGVDWKDPTSASWTGLEPLYTGTGTALKTITGQPIASDDAKPGIHSYDPTGKDIQGIQTALKQGKSVVAATKDDETDNKGNVTKVVVPPSTGLLSGHAYTVLDAYTDNGVDYVILRNPYHEDTIASTALDLPYRAQFSLGNDMDGYIRVTWDTFQQSMQRYLIA